MSRAARLLDLMQILRRHRYPISGAVLARELGVSLRSLYRDIATLQQNGATIDGAPGLGYLLRPGFLLPPIMLSADELEALVLGSRWVAERGDAHLAHAARNALAKIRAVLPAELHAQSDEAALLVGPGPSLSQFEVGADIDLAALRHAIRAERKLEIAYRDGSGALSTRIVWPLALGYFEQVQVLVAWCELRGQFRHFRADRLRSLTATPERYPRRRRVLVDEWRLTQGIADPRTDGTAEPGQGIRGGQRVAPDSQETDERAGVSPQ